ncbi:MAG TPA: type IV secretion protein Rhs, partial [Verrucomicrobiae bacterium]|nr:type IV secretion protein Rhs [Verrucomicrobiae bacterium]
METGLDVRALPSATLTFQNNGLTRLVTTRAYDALNRLTNIVSASNSVVYAAFAYGYNAANQRTNVITADASHWVYQYDKLGQVTSGKKYWSDGTAVAGQQFDYAFDDIGNRQSTTRDTRTASYTANLLNQYSSRTVPGYVNVLGEATNAATVTVWTQDGGFACERHDAYFRAEVTASNSAAPEWLNLTNLAVLNNGTNADLIATNTGNLFVAQTPETFQYDLDGNLTNDGRWLLTWDGENRLVKLESQAAAPTASKLKLEFVYDA